MQLNAKPLLAALLLTVSCFTDAGDAERGKTLSAACAACHGSNGIAQIPMYPNLAGQKEMYLAEAMRAYRDGVRKNMLMTPMAAGLSDKDIEDLAAYYSGLSPCPG